MPNGEPLPWVRSSLPKNWLERVLAWSRSVSHVGLILLLFVELKLLKSAEDRAWALFSGPFLALINHFLYAQLLKFRSHILGLWQSLLLTIKCHEVMIAKYRWSEGWLFSGEIVGDVMLYFYTAIEWVAEDVLLMVRLFFSTSFVFLLFEGVFFTTEAQVAIIVVLCTFHRFKIINN